MKRKTDSQFTPEIDSEIIRSYVSGQEVLFGGLEKKYGLSRKKIVTRASALGINRQLIAQLSLSDLTYGPRPCLRCEKMFLSRGPENRLCPRCIKKAG